MRSTDELIDLGTAAMMAIEAGLTEDAFLAALRSGAVDSRIVDGALRVSRHDLQCWCGHGGPELDRAEASLLALLHPHRKAS